MSEQPITVEALVDVLINRKLNLPPRIALTRQEALGVIAGAAS